VSQAPRIDIGNGVFAKLATCKGCGAPILWAHTSTGATVPLDPRPVVFRVERFTAAPDGALTELHVSATSRGELVERCFVSHFSTCSKAAEFSRGRRA
jgi:hypothetical protein